jgi:lysyl-tRNA synthetase class 2
MAGLEELREERLKKLSALRARGVEPYPVATRQPTALAAVIKNFAKLSVRKKPLVIAGRIRSIRSQGGVIFFHLDDGTASFQTLLKKDELAADAFELFANTVDLGDFVEVSGSLFITKQGEQTLLGRDWRMLAKSLRPLPGEWHGLADVEERFRRRYLDSLMSPEVKERFLLRAKLISGIRQFLDEAGFLEVETPVFQPIPGGASATPFVTHHEALDIDLYLRVSEELYLKRYLVGGFPRVYSLSRNFRNEGIDQTHNPEFTMLEWYEAYSTAEAQREFVAKLLRHLIDRLYGHSQFTYNGQTIDLGKPFTVVSYYDLLRSQALIADPATATREDLALVASRFNVALEPGAGREKILDSIYKKICRPKLIQPTFIVDYPANYLPLAKRKEGTPELVDAFQLVVGGVEVVKAFSELNDPLDQRARFEAQEAQREAGDAEAQRIDEDFIEALEYGMPPAGGVGIGIDRLAMLFTDTHNIKEVIFFPTLKPR